MQFFKIHGELEGENACEENDRRAKRELSYRIQTKTAEFNGVNNKEFCFISEIDEDFVTFGVIATYSINLLSREQIWTIYNNSSSIRQRSACAPRISMI